MCGKLRNPLFAVTCATASPSSSILAVMVEAYPIHSARWSSGQEVKILKCLNVFTSTVPLRRTNSPKNP